MDACEHLKFSGTLDTDLHCWLPAIIDTRSYDAVYGIQHADFFVKPEIDDLFAWWHRETLVQSGQGIVNHPPRLSQKVGFGGINCSRFEARNWLTTPKKSHGAFGQTRYLCKIFQSRIIF